MTSTHYPLHFDNGHLFLDINGSLWLFDTGAPTSFGLQTTLAIGDKTFDIIDNYMGLNSNTLSTLVSVECVGLLGADVLGEFDFLIDTANTNVEISSSSLEFPEHSISIEQLLGIPIVSAHIGNTDYKMFFDTGAQISYFQHQSLTTYPRAGTIDDFYPGFGEFQTETYIVDLKLGEINFDLRCGTLPQLLGASLMMAGTKGIIGNEVLFDRIVVYSPRKQIIAFSDLL